jgi:hypothetical protein
MGSTYLVITLCPNKCSCHGLAPSKRIVMGCPHLSSLGIDIFL